MSAAPPTASLVEQEIRAFWSGFRLGVSAGIAAALLGIAIARVFA